MVEIALIHNTSKLCKCIRGNFNHECCQYFQPKHEFTGKTARKLLKINTHLIHQEFHKNRVGNVVSIDIHFNVLLAFEPKVCKNVLINQY